LKARRKKYSKNKEGRSKGKRESGGAIGGKRGSLPRRKMGREEERKSGGKLGNP